MNPPCAHSNIINASFGWRRLQLAVRGVPAAVFRESGGRSTMFRERRVAVDLFRERALLHYPACCAASGSVPQHSSANERYCIAQLYSADSGDAFAFAEHMNYSLASRKTVAFAGGVSPLPDSANERYNIILSVARTAACKQYNHAAQRAQALPSNLLFLKQIARA